MQAARGTSLNPSEDHSEHHVRSGGRPHRRLLFAAVAVTAYLLDQWSKAWALDALADGADVSVVGDVLTLHLTRNPGAAFSLGTDYTAVLSVIAIAAAVVIGYLALRLRDRIWACGLGLVLAGVLGNLTDRVIREPSPFHGHVIDFLRLPNWPIFNVADVCINVGMALIVLQVLRGVHRDGTRERSVAPSPTET